MKSTKVDAATGDTKMIDALTACPIGATAVCASNTELATCDGQGNITGTSPCTLGCDTAMNRCKKVSASNGLSMHLDEAESAPDLMLSGAATINTDAGTITDQSGSRVLPTATIPASASVPIAVFVVKVKSFKTDGIVTVTGTRALAIISAGDVSIGHLVTLSANRGTNGPGAILNDASCRGSNAAASNTEGEPGGGGGAFGSIGGKGGNGGNPTITGANGGAVSGTPELVPLRGGCPGGRSSGAPTSYFPGGGGGAIQITSGTSITLIAGTLSANGGGGQGPVGPLFCISGNPCGQSEGGGAGGGVLLEAPAITIDGTSGIFVNGGGGTCSVDGSASNGSNSTTPAAGQTCVNNTGNGGNGAAGSTAAQNGVNKVGDDSVGGGGGGGVGRIRINLPVGVTFNPAGTTSGVLSVGALQTR